MIAEWIDSQNGLHRDLSSKRVMSLGDGGLEERSGREELSSRILGRDREPFHGFQLEENVIH